MFALFDLYINIILLFYRERTYRARTEGGVVSACEKIWRETIKKRKTGNREKSQPGQRLAWMSTPTPDHWCQLRSEGEQLLGYWVSCETVKGSAAPLIPRGEGEASMGCMPFSFTLNYPSSSYPPALVMTLLLNTFEQLDWLHRCMSINTVLNTLTLRGGIKDIFCSCEVVLSSLACEG